MPLQDTSECFGWGWGFLFFLGGGRRGYEPLYPNRRPNGLCWVAVGAPRTLVGLQPTAIAGQPTLVTDQRRGPLSEGGGSQPSPPLAPNELLVSLGGWGPYGA